MELPGWLARHRLGELLARVTAQDRERRGDVTSEALIEALEEIAGGELPVAPGSPPEPAPPAGRAERPRSPWLPGPERRLCAIVSADVVGYSRLRAEDEEATVRTVEAYREEIELHVRQHGGRIEFTGDNFLAEFPSALEAVRCAIEAQRVLRARNADLAPERRMEFRVGIHLGDVRVEGGRLFGTGVNVAACLEGLAEPGGICLSGTVREQLRGNLELALEDLGERQVKNIPHPVHAYRVRLDARAGPSVQPPRTSPRYRAAGAGALVLLLAAAVALWRSLEPAPPASPQGGAAVRALAVLPFVNLSADPEQEYFADGIAEELLNTVSRFEGLRVVGRTSSFSFRGSNADLKTIGEALGAEVILEGSVRTAGDRVRITAQLVDAGDGFHRWSGTYDRELGDVFAIQTEIATAIATALRVELSAEERERLATPPTRNLAAYQAYLLGRQRLERLEQEGAVGYFQQAIELDPRFALAYAGLTGSYLALFQDSDLPPDEIFAQAQAAVDKALELDADLAEAHVALGEVNWYRNDFEGAEAEFQRALALDPNSAAAHKLYGNFLWFDRARYDEALLLSTKAVDLDPLSLEANLQLAEALHALGRFEESLARCERLLEIDANYPDGYLCIGAHHASVLGRVDEAIAWHVKGLALNTGSPFVLSLLGELFLDLGDPDRAEYWVRRSVEGAPDNFFANLAMQELASYRGHDAIALEHARKAFAIFPLDWGGMPLSRLRDHEVRAGRYVEARALYQEHFPELLGEGDPEVDLRNYRAAIDLALVLSRTGEPERADALLDRSLHQIQELVFPAPGEPSRSR